MQVNIPPKVRATLYLITALGTPVVAYLRAKGVIGNLEVILWSTEVTAVNALAALKVAAK